MLRPLVALCLPLIACTPAVAQTQSPAPPSQSAATATTNSAPAQAEPTDESTEIRSTVEATSAGDLVLIHEVIIHAPVREVWDSHTTKAGWEAWAAPVAEVDVRPGGTIRTNYAPGAAVGDPGTNTLHILNVAPQRLLTLQAEPSPAWPKPMQQDAGRMYNVIVFEALDDNRTKLTSFGLGYRDTDEYRQLLTFFDQANVGLYRKLKQYLER